MTVPNKHYPGYVHAMSLSINTNVKAEPGTNDIDFEGTQESVKPQRRVS